MAWKDFLFGGPKAKQNRHISRARNKDAQSVDRMASLEALVQDASDEAILGLLGRFTMRYDKSIEDEQEKEFVFSSLVNMGEKVLGPLETHLLGSSSIAWGLRLLGEVASDDAQWAILEKLFAQNDNSYTRDPTKKIQIIHYVGDKVDQRIAAALVPYLEDVDEGVRFTACEGLLLQRQTEIGRDELLKLLLSEQEESRRIKKRIVDGFVDLDWNVKGFTNPVEKWVVELLPGARIDNQGKIKRKNP